MTNTNLFDDTESGTTPLSETINKELSNGAEDPVTLLVGEGKKYKTVTDLAKAKLEADTFIDTLKTENRDLREKSIPKEDVDKKLNDFLTKFQEQNKATGSREQTAPELDSSKIAEIVRNQITLTEQERTAAQNIKAAQDKIEGKYGEKAKEFLDKRAEELGMTRADFKTLSAKSPSALMKILGIDAAQATPSNGVNQGSVNTESKFNTNNLSPDSWDYYHNIRRQNPTLYYSSAIQTEIFNKTRDGKLA